MGQVLFRFVVGFVSGLIGWFLVELTAPPFTDKLAWGLFELRLDLIAGGLIALCLGAAIGWQRGSTRHAARGAVVGGLLGGMACAIGSHGGGLVGVILFGPGVFDTGAVGARMIARSFVGAGMGMLLGLVVGIAGGGGKRALLGFLGGISGGWISGFLFDPLSSAFSPFVQVLAASGDRTEVGQAGRMALFVTIGALVGAFTGLVELVAKTASIRLALGRNESKEWTIFSTPFSIGRDERADAPVFSDPTILARHLVISQSGAAYFLNAQGPALLNGQPVSQAPLADGDRIQAGGTVLTFHLRSGSAAAKAAEQMRGSQRPVTPIMMGGPAPAPMPMPGAAPAPAPAAGFVAVILDGPLAGRRFPISGTLEIGREAAPITLADDQRASRRHASLAEGPNGPIITDLGSTNGTHVNGQRVQTAVVRRGDTISCGATSLRIE